MEVNVSDASSTLLAPTEKSPFSTPKFSTSEAHARLHRLHLLVRHHRITTPPHALNCGPRCHVSIIATHATSPYRPHKPRHHVGHTCHVIMLASRATSSFWPHVPHHHVGHTCHVTMSATHATSSHVLHCSRGRTHLPFLPHRPNVAATSSRA